MVLYHSIEKSLIDPGTSVTLQLPLTLNAGAASAVTPGE